jgi:hypothetical protein
VETPSVGNINIGIGKNKDCTKLSEFWFK